MNRWAGLSALLLILSYPPFDLGWLAWGALVPWLFSLGNVPPEGGISLDKNFKETTPRQAFLRSYLVGFFFFAGTIGWVGHVTIVGTILLVAYLALYFGAWGWFANRLIAHPQGARSTRPLLGLPAAWAVLEYLRGILLTGFGWNLLAHTQWNWIPIIQIADVTGVYGVSFLVALVNVALFSAIRGRRSEVRGQWSVDRKSFLCFLFSVLCLLVTLAYGILRLRSMDEGARSTRPLLKVAVVQGNIPQQEKWDEAFREEIWKRYEALTAEAAKEGPSIPSFGGRVEGRPDLIVWPETAVPDFLEEESTLDPLFRGESRGQALERLGKLARESGSWLLVGVPSSDEISQLFNSAALVSPEGQLIERHDKLHLVPFGEYIPLQPLLGWLRQIVLLGDFSPGEEFTLFQLATGNSKLETAFSVLICFEDLFPDLSRRFVREGARWLIVITNDAWFGRSAASLQHLQASVFRAVENRVSVARAANTGWSGFVDPTGRRFPEPHQVPRFEPGVAAAMLSVSPWGETLYSRWGDWFPIFCGIMTLLLPGLSRAHFRRWKRWISLSSNGLQN